jgi:MFS family permease
VEQRELGKSFGYHRAMDTIGATLGPLTAVFLLPLIMNDYRLLFKISFLIGILAIITFVFVHDVKKKIAIMPGGEVPAHPPFSFSLREYSRQFHEYILAVFMFGLGFMPIALMLLKSQEVGLDGFSMPLMYFIYNLSFVLFAIPAGKLSDYIGEKRVLALGFLAAIIAYLNMIFFSSIATVVAGFVILGVYSAFTDGVERAFATKLVPSHKLATGQGFLNAAVGISSLLAGLIGGGIWTQLGSRAALIYGAAMMTIGLGVFLHLHRHRVEKSV